MQNRLERRIEDRRAERDRIYGMDKEYQDHMRTIREAYRVTKMDFWCRECREDFSAIGYKIIGEAGRWPVAWYNGQCPLGHVCIRHITDKEHDPYYWMSDRIQRDRVELKDAMLIPSDPRFKLVYPDKWRDLERMRDE